MKCIYPLVILVLTLKKYHTVHNLNSLVKSTTNPGPARGPDVCHFTITSIVCMLMRTCCCWAGMRWGQTDGQCQPILFCFWSQHTWLNWLNRIWASTSEVEKHGRCTRSLPRCLEKQLDGTERHPDAHWNCRAWMEDLRLGIVGGPRSAVRAVESVLARVREKSSLSRLPAAAQSPV